MDNQKTGALIAARRTELGLTQKQLAERLHISDRTVSKWERGAGVPDISLLEPAADALELSVTELLRGERLPQENQLSPSTERSVRDAFREFGLRFKRHQRLLIAAVSILGVLLLLWLLLFLSPFRAHKADHREVTAAEAATLDPTCLITREEFDLLRRMSEDPELIALLREAATTDGISLEAAPEITGRYRALLPIDGQPAEFFSIQAFSYGDLYVLYRLEDRSWSLTLTPEGTVTKHSVVYEYEDEFSLPNSSSISNTDNLTFQYRGPQQLDRPGTLRLLLDHIF